MMLTERATYTQIYAAQVVLRIGGSASRASLSLSVYVYCNWFRVHLDPEIAPGTLVGV